METIKDNAQKVMLILLKSIVIRQTATSLAKELNLSRAGAWKIIKKLEKEELIILKPTGEGKTSSQQILLNWDNPLVEKKLSLSLMHEALLQRRWRATFKDLEKKVGFLILYGSVLHSPKEANDIDIICVTNEKKIGKISGFVLKIQETQLKKIHGINFTEKEFKQELNKPNRAFVDALKKGIVLFGQDNFIKFISGFRR